MKLRRSLVVLAAAGAMALTLSGCFVIVSDTPSQENMIGDVVVHTVACISGTMPSDSCPRGNDPSDYFNESGNSKGQLLLAYRVPDGYGAPTQITSTAGTPALVMDASPSYVQSLTTIVPPPAGERWVGYLSQNLTSITNNAEYTFDTRFTRPPAQDGVPSSLPFKYLTVTGGRSTDNLGAGRDISCGASFSTLATGLIEGSNPFDGTTCAMSPPTVSGGTALPDDTVLFPRDLAIAPGSASASRNSTVNVPFTLNYVGPSDPSLLFALTSGINGLAGATAAPASPTFNPASNSSTVQNVVVKVPANAKAGNYSVPFGATLANGATRNAVSTLTVLPDTKGPGVTISLAKTRLAKGASKGFKITISCNEDCSIVATLTATSKALRVSKTVKLGSAEASLTAAGKKTLTVKINRGGKRKLKALAKHHRKLKGKLTVVAIDGAGNKTTASKRVSLR